MPSPRSTQEKTLRSVPTGLNYDDNKLWRQKPLTPAQLLVTDVRLEKWRADRGPMLETKERSAAQMVPETAALTTSASTINASDVASNPIEKQRFINLEEEYGWIRHLRLEKHQRYATDSDDSAKLRWIHVSSKFPEYLCGFLWALSDNRSSLSASINYMDHVVQKHTRFSKHGKYFAPFFEQLAPRKRRNPLETFEQYPALLACPFLDWSVQGQPPPLRFQVDRREGFFSSRSSAHLLRSLMQHYYRLEDTADREKSQVFNKHKPWTTDRELDLKVRQWYGHYPSALNVDEIWILCVDAQHIVTFSSNQTWKSRWPPLQLTSRISDVSFRGIRNSYFRYSNSEREDYTAMTHAVASLTGAVGMLHRNFWPDMVLCLADRYAGHLGHLKYRLHRSPSTKLVMDLIACEDELNIVCQVTQQQVEIIKNFQSYLGLDMDESPTDAQVSSKTPPAHSRSFYGAPQDPQATRYRSTYRQLSLSTITDPVAQLLDNLQREAADLQDLRENANNLVTRTIQLVNIRLEDHGKAIMVFTVVTIIFLPLNFVSSFFGMNTKDLRNLDYGQWLFWVVAVSLTAGVAGGSVFLAFSGAKIYDRISAWRQTHREQELSTTTILRQAGQNAELNTFRVYGVSGPASALKRNEY